MAEYRDRYADLKVAGVAMAAISVDDASRSAPMKAELKLPFPILCDSSRELITRWGLLNRAERGGIAYPAVFAIDLGLAVRFRSLDRTAQRAAAAEVAAAAGSAIRDASVEPKFRLRTLQPGLMFLFALRNAITRGTRTPWSRGSAD